MMKRLSDPTFLLADRSSPDHSRVSFYAPQHWRFFRT
jgi:hypothetical protein